MYNCLFTLFQRLLTPSQQRGGADWFAYGGAGAWGDFHLAPDVFWLSHFVFFCWVG